MGFLSCELWLRQDRKELGKAPDKCNEAAGLDFTSQSASRSSPSMIKRKMAYDRKFLPWSEKSATRKSGWNQIFPRWRKNWPETILKLILCQVEGEPWRTNTMTLLEGTILRSRFPPMPHQKVESEFGSTKFRNNPPWKHIKPQELTNHRHNSQVHLCPLQVHFCFSHRAVS